MNPPLFLRGSTVLLALLIVSVSCADDHAVRPNVLFIAVDDLNDFAFGLNHEIQAETPQMDSLASRGTLFTNAHCAAPACNPSRVSVMTGVAPATSGVYKNGQDWRQCSRLQGLTTLPQHFRDHGYKVIGGGKLYHAANLSISGLEGFLDPKPWHEFFPSKTRQLADDLVPAGNSVNGSNKFYGGRFDWDSLDIDDDAMGDGKVVSWAERQLATAHDQPLFLAVGLYRPHIPWYTPKKYFNRNPIERIKLPGDPESDLVDLPEFAQTMSKHSWHQWLVDHGKWPAAVQAYMASVSFADEMVGRLVRALDNGPMAKNTIIVLWSDHGYHLGHKKHWEKRVIWEQATHVPIVIVPPSPTKSPIQPDGVSPTTSDASVIQPGRCDRPVSLLDLYPTLVELAGLGRPDHLEGESLRRFLTDPQATSNRAVVSTYPENCHAIRSQHWRYMRYSDGSEELYDHRTDPGELKNLAAKTKYQDVRDRLAKYLPKSNAPVDPPFQPRQTK